MGECMAPHRRFVLGERDQRGMGLVPAMRTCWRCDAPIGERHEDDPTSHACTEELRYRVIVGCDAVHPDRRGGQHVAMSCSGVLVIDQQSGLGVMVADERSMIKNKARAMRLLKLITEHDLA